MYVRVKIRRKFMARVEKKYVVQADSKISDIYSKLNSVQKQTVSLFDKDRNGVLDKNEAKAFNNTVFSDKGDSVDCWIQLSSGKKQKVSVKKDAIDTSALSLSLKETAKKKVGNKIYHYQEERLSRENCESTKEALKEKFRKNSQGYEYDSQDKNGNVKYTRNYGDDIKKPDGSIAADYIILDKFGEVVEMSDVVIRGSENVPVYYYGRIVQKGNAETYYDSKDKIVGSSEILSNGRALYKDAKGKALFQIKENANNSEYYDTDGHLLYTVSANDIGFGGTVKVEIYNKEGIVVKRETVTDGYYGESPFALVRGINKNPIGSDGGLDLYAKPYDE